MAMYKYPARSGPELGLRRALLLHGGPDNRTLTRRSARLLVRDEASLRPAELDGLCLLVPGWAEGSGRCGGAGRGCGGLFSQDVAQDLACGVARDGVGDDDLGWPLGGGDARREPVQEFAAEVGAWGRGGTGGVGVVRDDEGHWPLAADRVR